MVVPGDDINIKMLFCRIFDWIVVSFLLCLRMPQVSTVVHSRIAPGVDFWVKFKISSAGWQQKLKSIEPWWLARAALVACALMGMEKCSMLHLWGDVKSIAILEL